MTPPFAPPRGRWTAHTRHLDGYALRYIVETPLGGVRLQRLLASDPVGRGYHDHPWSYVTVPLTGSYVEITPDGAQLVSARRPHYRPAEALHRLVLLEGPVWTLVFTGPRRRGWGFQIGGTWHPWQWWRAKWAAMARGHDTVVPGEVTRGDA